MNDKQPTYSHKVRQRNQEDLAKLLTERRWCYVIPESGFVPGHGYRVSITIEHVKGHFPTGDLEVLGDDSKAVRQAYRDGAQAPWFWGMTLAEAQKECARRNEQELGLTPADVALIVVSTMG